MPAILKIVALFVFISNFPTNTFAQSTVPEPVIEFQNDTLLVFVDGQTDSCLKYFFKFTNKGNEPLIIENARGSDPDFPFYFPKDPVLPGKTDSIGIILIRQQLSIPRLKRIYSVHYNGGYKKFIYLIRIHKRKV